MDGTTIVSWFSMLHITNNTTSRVALNYNIVDDLAQSPITIYALEVLKFFPSQCKSFLSTPGFIDPYESRLITFDLDQG